MFIHKYENSPEINYVALPGLLNSYRIDIKKEEINKQLEVLLREISDERMVDFEEAKSPCRKRELVVTRQIYCYLAKRHTKHSLKTIGENMGNRDHTTVMHSIQTITDLMETDDEIQEEVHRIENKIIYNENADFAYETIKVKAS